MDGVQSRGYVLCVFPIEKKNIEAALKLLGRLLVEGGHVLSNSIGVNKVDAYVQYCLSILIEGVGIWDAILSLYLMWSDYMILEFGKHLNRRSHRERKERS